MNNYKSFLNLIYKAFIVLLKDRIVKLNFQDYGSITKTVLPRAPSFENF